MDQLVATPPGYPAELERAVTLRNGARVQIRPILPEDESRLIEFHERLSPDTAYRRFFTVMRTLPSELAHHLANVDYRRRLALVAELLGGEVAAVIGVTRLEPMKSPTTAELALVVEDAWQRLGLGDDPAGSHPPRGRATRYRRLPRRRADEQPGDAPPARDSHGGHAAAAAAIQSHGNLLPSQVAFQIGRAHV